MPEILLRVSIEYFLRPFRDDLLFFNLILVTVLLAISCQLENMFLLEAITFTARLSENLRISDLPDNQPLSDKNLLRRRRFIIPKVPCAGRSFVDFQRNFETRRGLQLGRRSAQRNVKATEFSTKKAAAPP